VVSIELPDRRHYHAGVATHGERTALVSFLASAILAGGNAVCIRFTNRELAPLWGAGLRFALAAALLAAVVAAMRLELPRGRALVGSVLYGALQFGGAFALAYYGFVRIPAGLGQTILAVVPLATLLLAVLQRQERLHVAAVVGGILALAGVGVMYGAPVGRSIPFTSVLALVGAALCFGQAAIVVRRFPPVHPVAMNAIGMISGAALLVGASLFVGVRFELPQRPATWAALAYLVVVGSVLVFVLILVVLRYWTASRAAYGFVISPPVTLILSAWLLDEPVGWELAGGGLLVMAGVYIGALRRSTGGPQVSTAVRTR
jgi:drug/metabolite transporter (DMT)-like permease